MEPSVKTKKEFLLETIRETNKVIRRWIVVHNTNPDKIGLRDVESVFKGNFNKNVLQRSKYANRINKGILLQIDNQTKMITHLKILYDQYAYYGISDNLICTLGKEALNITEQEYKDCTKVDDELDVEEKKLINDELSISFASINNIKF